MHDTERERQNRFPRLVCEVKLVVSFWVAKLTCITSLRRRTHVCLTSSEGALRTMRQSLAIGSRPVHTENLHSSPSICSVTPSSEVYIQIKKIISLIYLWIRYMKQCEVYHGKQKTIHPGVDVVTIHYMFTCHYVK